MPRILPPIVIAMLLAAMAPCAATSPFEEVRIKGFQSSDPERCKISDVDLDAASATTFFKRARKVDARTVHDRYDIAPCQMEGDLAYRGQTCSWSIDAGAVATVACDDELSYYVCDRCQALLTPKARKKAGQR